MRRSDERILTTHAGSLPRPPALLDALVRRSKGETVDLDDVAAAAVEDVVARQVVAGIDVGNNGEMPRESFFTYVANRMTGFGGQSDRSIMRDMVDFEGFLAAKVPEWGSRPVSLMTAPACIGPVAYADRTALDAELADFATYADRFVEPFMTAPSPGIVASAMSNRHYDTLEEYVAAVGEALATEYRAIVDQGFLLQIDAPDLAMERHTLFAEAPLEEFLRFVATVVAAINQALDGIPSDRARLHVCWGNYPGPHTRDVALEAILPVVSEARVGGFVLSMANPRHAHEHRVLRDHPLPGDAVLVAGVIDTTTNYVEHPEVVADRLEQAAEAVGDPTRVIAGTDCGFATSAGFGNVVDSVVWAKLEALRDGAALASSRLL